MLLIKNNACTLIIVKQFLRRMKYSIFILFNPGKYPDRGQACQNIPFKSRRRAVSHHRNRIPKRVRKYHSDIEPAKKRPSNKYRKRRDQKTRDGLCTKVSFFCQCSAVTNNPTQKIYHPYFHWYFYQNTSVCMH